MVNYLIPEDLRDEMVRYLLTRPCGEVMNAVLALQQLRKALDAGPDDKG